MCTIAIIPYHNIINNTVEVGFYEPGFYELSLFMNFFQSSLECLFKLITPDFMNFALYELFLLVPGEFIKTDFYCILKKIHNLTLRHVPIDFKFYRLLENIQDKVFTKFGVAWVSLLLFFKQYVEKSNFFRKNTSFTY